MLASTLASACGSSRGRPAPTRAQFGAAAETVCRHEQLKLAAIAMRASHLSKPPLRPELIRQQVAQSQLATARLEALRRPSLEREAITRWLTARTVAATVALDLAEAPPHGAERARLDVEAELRLTRARARALARANRVISCSEVD